MTEHEKLVERVARAISDKLGHDWSEAGQGVKEICEECATAAIAAVHAALQAPTWMNDGDYVGYTPRQAWDTMIERSPLKEVDG